MYDGDKIPVARWRLCQMARELRDLLSDDIYEYGETPPERTLRMFHAHVIADRLRLAAHRNFSTYQWRLSDTDRETFNTLLCDLDDRLQDEYMAERRVSEKDI